MSKLEEKKPSLPEDVSQLTPKKQKWKFDKKLFVETLPMKLAILCFSAGAISIFPFLVLQMQLLGITIKEIALLYLFTPISSLLGPIISGLIADKTGKFTTVLVVAILLSMVTSNCLLLVPAVEKPSNMVSLICNPDSSLSVKYQACTSCMLDSDLENNYLEIEKCEPCEYLDEDIKKSDLLETKNTFDCPVFSNKHQIYLSVAKPNDFSNASCIMDVYNVNKTNIPFSIEKMSVATVRKFCDYKCQIKTHIKGCEDAVGYTFSRSFLIYGILLIISNLFFSASFTMMDASLLTFVKQHNLEMGKQRILIMIGFGLTPLLVGICLDLYTKYTGIVSYLPAFLLADIFLLFGAIFMSKIHLEVDQNESNIIKDLGRLVSRVEVDAFLFIVLILGSNFGFIESYLFIYLRSLGAPGFLLGLTMTVGCLSSVPMLYYSDWFTKKVGRQFVFILCFTAYAARMLGYSYIEDPWMALVFETLEAFTYQLLWVTCLNLCPLLAPKGLLATMTGVTGAVHYSFGKAIGGFFGGFLIDAYGLKIAFRIFAGISLAGGVVYLIVHHTLLKSRILMREEELKQEHEKSEEKKTFLGNFEETEEVKVNGTNNFRFNTASVQKSPQQVQQFHPKLTMRERDATPETVYRRLSKNVLNISAPRLFVADGELGSLSNISKSLGNLVT